MCRKQKPACNEQDSKQSSTQRPSCSTAATGKLSNCYRASTGDREQRDSEQKRSIEQNEKSRRNLRQSEHTRPTCRKSVVRSPRVSGTARLRGCTRIRRSWCLWKEGTPPGTRCTHGGCTAEEIFGRTGRCFRPHCEEHSEFSTSDRRVGQYGN